MKKFLIFSVVFLISFFGFSIVKAQEKTISTDLGDINFDLEQIIEDNPTLNFGEDYIIAKRGNLDDIILSININNNYLSASYNYNSNYNNTGYSSFNRANVYVFLYNFNTNNFEYYRTMAEGSSFIHLNLIYDSSINSIKLMDNDNWYNVNLVSNGNYYNFDFENKIFLFNNIFYEDSKDLVTNEIRVLNYSNNSSYTSELVNNNSNRLSNINNFNTDSANLIKGNTWQQYGQYYFSVGSRNYFSNSLDFVKLGYYKNKNTGLFEHSFIIDVSKTVYFYHTVNTSFRFKLMSSTNTPGWAIPRFFGSLITDTNSTDNTGFFTNLPEIKLMDNVSLSLYDKNFSPGSTVFLTDNNNIVYLDGYYNPIPTVTFNSTYNTDNENRNVSITVNSIFSSFDITKYKFYYKTNNDSDWIILAYNQQMINSKTFTKTFNFNGNLAIKITDIENNTLSTYTYQWDRIEPPTVDYTIDVVDRAYMNDNKIFYNINLSYKYMNDNYYSVYYNLKDGTTKDLGYNVQEYSINNINDDAIITVYIYDKNDNMIYYTTIDLQTIKNEINTNEDPYIFIMGYNQKNLPNSVAYKYYNTNDNDYKCYYKFGGGELTQESCSSNEIIFRNAQYNTSLFVAIYDNNDNIIDKKELNLNFINNYPRLEFETYYNSSINAQILNVKFFDYYEFDELYYSMDNVNFQKLLTTDINTLTFYQDADLYFKIYRNHEIISDSFYKLKIGNFSISISEEKTYEEIKDLTNSPTNLLDVISNNSNYDKNVFSYIIPVYNLLTSSTIGHYLRLIIFGAILILIIKAITKK